MITIAFRNRRDLYTSVSLAYFYNPSGILQATYDNLLTLSTEVYTVMVLDEMIPDHEIMLSEIDYTL